MGRSCSVRPFVRSGVSTLVCAAVTAWVGTAQAANFEVTTLTQLRGAIEQSNDNNEADVITLTNGIIIADGQASGNTALPAITSEITIKGQGAAATTLERTATSAEFRLLKVESGGNLTLKDLTLKGGYLSHLQGRTYENTGGAVQNYGTLTVRNVTFVENAADAGGAISNIEGAELYVYDSTFERNQTTWGWADGDGAAILSEAAYAEIERSIFRDNKTGLEPSDKRQSDGGAIENSIGEMLIKDSVFVGNVSYCGGAIENAIGKLTVINSTFKDNFGVLHAGAIYGSEPRARYDTSNFGDGVIEIYNSTLSENEAGEEGGGGVFMDAGIAIIRNSVLAQNVAFDANGVAVAGRQDCGYIFNDEDGTQGRIIVQGTNLITDMGNCLAENDAFDGETATVIHGDGVAALQWNADHYTLGSASLAIAQGAECEATDQLGNNRAAACDLGAVENVALTTPNFVPDANRISVIGGFVMPTFEVNNDQNQDNQGDSQDEDAGDENAVDDQQQSGSSQVSANSQSSAELRASSGGGGAFNPLLLMLPALLGLRRRKA